MRISPGRILAATVMWILTLVAIVFFKLGWWAAVLGGLTGWFTGKVLFDEN